MTGSVKEHRRHRTAAEVIAAMYVGLAVAALLGRADLAAVIARAEHGPLRDVALSFLDEPAPPSPPEVVTQAVAVESAAPPPPPPPTPTPEAEPVPVPAHPPWWRAVSTSAPLRVWIVGDSLLNMTAPAVERRLEETGRATVQKETRSSTGLVRPDYFDWSRRFRQVLSSDAPPEAVVVMLGANDSQHMRAADGAFLERHSSPWLEEYTRRVEGLMAQAAAAEVRLYWVGLPVMRKPRRQRTAELINPRIAAAAEAHAGVRFLSTWEIYAGEGGTYRWWGLSPEGRRVAMRDPDGSHFSMTGSLVLADLLLGALDDDWQVLTGEPGDTAAPGDSGVPDSASP